ncbi:MAG TPA: tetraacyldisaccharide 4'-kinase, partial [Thermoanaerobaculia bacterium]|nr:tetraacyldisaccharide 4'-kinase [Thermoanaerobaculia bacterium]
LREPLASATRAHAVLLTGGTAEEARDVARSLSAFGFHGSGFAVALINPPPRMISGEPLPQGARVLVVSGIARPQRFLNSVERSGLEIAGSLSFHDHHGYPSSSLQVIEGRAKAIGADFVLTTAKDRIKLAGRLTIGLAELDLEARPEPAFYSWIDDELDRLRRKGEAG